MDTNPNGVSLQDVADLIESEDDQAVDESGEQEAVEEVAQSDEPEAAEETQEEATDDDAEEVEFEGKQYKVPKELKAALLRQSDYTQKTQAVAEQRKAVEEKAQLLQQREAAMSAQFEKAVEMRAVQDQLAKFKNIDWQSLADTDPVQATKLNLAYQQLQQQAAEKYSEFQRAGAQAEQLAQQQRQQMLSDAQKTLKERLPSFNAETAEKIKTAARDYGISDKELNEVIDPRYVHVLHDAMQWRALQAKQPQAMKKVTEAPKVVKPAAKVTSKPINQAAADRIKSGKGSVRDLAAFL